MRKPIARGTLVLAVAATLSACGERESSNESAEDFAARINNQAAPPEPAAPPEAPAAPSIAQPQPGAAPGPYEQGTQTDPRARLCGAPQAAEFLGRADSAAVRQEIASVVPEGGLVRVVRPGDATTEDYRENRLNVMLDTSGIIRDLRCG